MTDEQRLLEAVDNLLDEDPATPAHRVLAAIVDVLGITEGDYFLLLTAAHGHRLTCELLGVPDINSRYLDDLSARIRTLLNASKGADDA